MKEHKLFFSILTIIVNFLATLVFFVPSWYLQDTIIINGVPTNLSNTSIRPFDYDLLYETQDMYAKNGGNLNISFSIAFCVLIMAAIAASAILAISTIIHISKPRQITLRIQKILSLIILVLCIAVVIVSIIFTIKGSLNIVDSETTTHTWSMQMSTGIYLFLILEITGLFSSNIANSLPEEKEDEEKEVA